MAIPPSKDLAGDQVKLGLAIQAIGADVLGIQEVDEKLARSGGISQTALVAEAMGSEHWAFAPVMVGEPGSKWRSLNSIDLKIVTKENVALNRQSNVDGNYGIGIVSKIPVIHWDRLELGKSVAGMPLVILAENKKRKAIDSLYLCCR
jgi:endonuclease/exonuclease/phosphatase family metal-dependent hydrolase